MQHNLSLHVYFISDKIVLKCVKTHDSRIAISDLASWWSGLGFDAKVTLVCALLVPAAACLLTGNSDTATVVSDQAASSLVAELRL